MKRILVVALVVCVALPASALADPFPAGSLILPSDENHQDAGVFTVYGLLNQLLIADVPVTWSILPGKAVGAIDFSADASLYDGSSDQSRDYRGGPWIVNAADVTPGALAVVDDWLAAHPATAVHIATDAFDAPVERVLGAAAPVAVAVDGNEDIAFSYLNAAGIPDSLGNPWPSAILGDYSAWPDVLTPAAIVGDPGVVGDGALFDAGGLSIYAELDFMHYHPTAVPAGLVAELQQFLTDDFNHLFLECRSILTFETTASAHFLTTDGIANGGDPGTNLSYLGMDAPVAQHHGGFDPHGGSVRSVALSSGSAYHAGVVTHIKKATEPVGERDALVSGNYAGDPDNGWVTFLGGHEYSVATPASGNGEASGVRFYLNGLFLSDKWLGENIPAWTLEKTGPAVTLDPDITWEIAWSSTGLGSSVGVQLVDELPAGVAFVGASSGGGVRRVGPHGDVVARQRRGRRQRHGQRRGHRERARDLRQHRGGHVPRRPHPQGHAVRRGDHGPRRGLRRRRLRLAGRLRRRRRHRVPGGA
jgi:hypothetical protein